MPIRQHFILTLAAISMSGFCRIAFGFSTTGVTAGRKLISHLSVLMEPMSTSTHRSEDDVLEPLIVCGPSGVGKGTIINKFMEELGGKNNFEFTVSHTTRNPREGELDGIHYHFVNKNKMKNAIEEGAFLEHAEVHGNFYGTSWAALRNVQDDGKRCLLDIDVQGVKNIRTMESDILRPKYVFIAPPSLEVLKQRLIGRGTESAESLACRTRNAEEELEYGLEAGNFDSTIINNDLDQACEEFSRVVQDLFDL